MSSPYWIMYGYCHNLLKMDFALARQLNFGTSNENEKWKNESYRLPSLFSFSLPPSSFLPLSTPPIWFNCITNTHVWNYPLLIPKCLLALTDFLWSLNSRIPAKEVFPVWGIYNYKYTKHVLQHHNVIKIHSCFGTKFENGEQLNTAFLTPPFQEANIYV